MGTFYIDPDSGNDANAGTSFALAWKTFKTGATAARIAPGDVIRVKASPLPSSLGINATFTNASDTVTLASALTANISTCESSWTAATDVTCSTSTTRKEGSFAVTHAIAAGFTTGKVAYLDLGSNQDFSTYEQVSFWIWQTSGSTLHAAGVFEIKLCSDTTGDTPIDTIVVPSFGSTNAGHAFTVGRNGGGALGSAIRSIALYAASDPGTVTIALDNILAVKASSAADSLSLTSLIGKSGSTETWWAIRSINGTTVKLDQAGGTFTSTAARGYAGTTATVAAYKRECFKTATAVSGNINEIEDSGTEGNPITFSGGWDRTDMSTQLTGEDGMSWFDGTNNLCFGLATNSKNYLVLERLGMTRYDYGIYVPAGTSLLFNYCSSNCNQRVGWGETATYVQISNGFFVQNGSHGINFNICQNIMLDNIFCGSSSGSGSGIVFTSATAVWARALTLRNNIQYGINTTRSQGDIFGLTTADNVQGGIINTGTQWFIWDWSASEATEVNHQLNYSNWKVHSTRHDDTVDNHRTFLDGGLISSDTSNRRTAADIAWSVAPTSALRNANNPIIMKFAEIHCVSGALVTASIWVKRTNTALSAKLVCRGKQIAGVDTDVTATATGLANVYEELTISFTPSESGVVELETHTYGGTTHTAYYDDVTIT